MEHRTFLRRTVLAVVAPAVLALSSLAAAAAEPGSEGRLDKPSETLTMLQSLEGSAFEVAFLKQMIHHHRSAIAMGQLVPERAQSEELKGLASKMVGAQESEVGKMTKWLDEWHDATPQQQFVDERANAEMKRQMEQLRGARGSAFDRLFVAAMSEHHREGVAMADLLGRRTARDDLRAFAAKMKQDQAKEIEEMAALSPKPSRSSTP